MSQQGSSSHPVVKEAVIGGVVLAVFVVMSLVSAVIGAAWTIIEIVLAVRVVSGPPASPSSSSSSAVPEKVSPSPLRSLEELGTWLADGPWASYSLELPLAHSFWLSGLGRSSAGPHLAAPDLRAVLQAVEIGFGSACCPRFCFM
ncbi:MAG: hypothetical protein ACYDEY_13230 [Acidimicrobiales bacterium]